MQAYDINLPVNGARDLDAPGRSFYYYSGSAGGADSTITLREDTSGTTIQLKPGQAHRVADDVKRVTRWRIQNYANAATIVGVVYIGDGQITDNRVTGSVEVIDGGKARTFANQSFIGFGSQGAAAGVNAHLQLWNPVGSGKNLIVERFTVSVDIAQTYFAVNSAPITTLLSNPKSKLSGVVSSVAEVRTYSIASPFTPLGGFTATPNTSLIYTFAEPFVIQPGKGLVVWANATNAGIQSLFEFFEEGA